MPLVEAGEVLARLFNATGDDLDLLLAVEFLAKLMIERRPEEPQLESSISSHA